MDASDLGCSNDDRLGLFGEHEPLHRRAVEKVQVGTRPNDRVGALGVEFAKDRGPDHAAMTGNKGSHWTAQSSLTTLGL